MPSNEQRREAAKRKLERQLVRRAERARRRRTIAVVVTVVAVVAVVGGVYAIATSGSGSNSTAAAASDTSAAPTTTAAPGVPTKGPCKYTTTPSQPAPTGKDVGVPNDPTPTPNTGTVNVTLQTSQGPIAVTLNRAAAPCTVQSFQHLVQSKFYDNTPCHRMTNYDNPPLYVLQCGDPTGTGQGGPGYTIPDENPKTLAAAPSSASAAAGTAESVYPAGTLAMANTGQANSGGSQFFIVYKDSYLPPSYAVFGSLTPAGLDTLNRIAAGGLTPGTDPSTGQATPNDGAPKLKVTITQGTTD